MLSPNHVQSHVQAGIDVFHAQYAGRPAQGIMRDAITHDFAGRIALVSSFGAESAVLLHMIAQVDRATPVLFGDTGMLFPETQTYREQLIDRLGLTDIRFVRPNPAAVETGDKDGTLSSRDTTACCFLRKVAPMQRAKAGFDAIITGRKRYQAATRRTLDVVEKDADGKVSLNPLFGWKAQDLSDYMHRNVLPRHPLVADGFQSIGCAPCTTAVKDGEDARAGRWRGEDKIECGIHFINGRVVRGSAQQGN